MIKSKNLPFPKGIFVLLQTPLKDRSTLIIGILKIQTGINLSFIFFGKSFKLSNGNY